MFMLVFAAIGVFGAGMLAIAAGIPIKDFGFGNTLILSGVLAWCTSAIMITLWACFRDLKDGIHQPERRPRESDAAAPEARAALPAPASPSGWPETIPERAPPAAPALPQPPVPAETREQRRNLLFASNRRPREAARPAEANAQVAAPAPLPPSPAPQPPQMEEPRPPARRAETPPPRTVRPVSTVGPRDPVSAPPLPAAPLPPPAPPPMPTPPSPPSEPVASVPPREPERQVRTDNGSGATVLKSGVVDGMAYWLFSDGSIEAQMPEGMMRFSSIDELRAHLDKRS